jgi:hypothetical protein
MNDERTRVEKRADKYFNMLRDCTITDLRAKPRTPWYEYLEFLAPNEI